LAPRVVAARAFDALPENDGHIVIAGFGRVGQIVARILLAKRIPFTALDSDPQHVDTVRRYGARAFYGDASRPEILDAAQTGKARAFVLAIDDVEASLRTARMVRQRYPHLPIYARSRHRRHTHQLMDLGIRIIRRETFLSALDLTSELLRGLGLSERDVRFAVETFKAADRRRLYEDYQHYTDVEKMQAQARTHAQELEDIFAQDAAEQAKAAATREKIPLSP
jgi:voltage-gated potassium channel Kch